MIREAGRQNCQLVVLPECLDVGWTHPGARELAEPVPGPRSRRLSDACRDAGISVVAGLTERDDDRIFNCAVVIDPDGQLRMKYRKINVLGIAQDLYAVGDRLGVVSTDLGRLGVNICADNFPNSLDIGRTLGRMNARLLVSPSAWAVDANHDQQAQPYGSLWRDAYGQLAREFLMPVVGVSNIGPITGGPWQGRKCIGCSLIVEAHGRPVATGPYDREALIIADVQLYAPPAIGTSISGAV
jgi:predicted amidohydrolase